MSQITSHVLDTSTGKPATELAIHLEQKRSGKWHTLAKKETNSDGRVVDFFAKDHAVAAGEYRMCFDTKAYFQGQEKSCFYPYVEIVFSIAAAELEDHFHIPLLLSPYGYSTYRGS